MITDPTEKKSVTQRYFIHRMRKRSVVDEVKDLRKSNQNVFLDRMRLVRQNRSPEFTETELDKVLEKIENW